MIETVRTTCLAGKPLPDYLYDKFLAHFRRFLVVGGMPAAVEACVETRDMASVRTIQRDILTLYKADISQYSPVDQRRMWGCLPVTSLPMLMSRCSVARNRRLTSAGSMRTL
ncbi:MAG: hypothetical protein SPI77_03990 [Corynebacterium sp.]|nr:hypothetical protein [Corynebacterium sp.]